MVTSATFAAAAAAAPVAPAVFVSTALHRRITQELTEFHAELQREPDVLSQQCAGVCARFLHVIQIHSDAAHVLDQCKSLLRQVLIDPMSRELLTPTALLGSDGHTYNRRTILDYREHHRHGSPLYPAEPSPFSVVVINHALRRLIEWSRQSPEEAEDDAELAAFAAQLAALRAGLRNGFAEQRRRTDAFAQGAHARIDAMHENLVDQQQDLATMALALEGEVDANLAIEVHEHAVRIAELEQRIQYVRQDIALCRQQDYQLQLAIEQTKKAIKERERGWIKDVVKAVVIIGACWFAQWALGHALSAAGFSGVKVGSMASQTGGRVSATIPLPYK